MQRKSKVINIVCMTCCMWFGYVYWPEGVNLQRSAYSTASMHNGTEQVPVKSANSSVAEVSKNNTSAPEEVQSSAKSDEEKVILLWYPHYSYYGFGGGNTGFRSWNCSVASCTLVDDRTQENMADAILYRASSRTQDIPRRTNTKQIMVFMEFESPLNMPVFKLRNLSGLFNLTMTYMRGLDTDIHVPYGEIVRHHAAILPDQLEPTLEQVKAKTKLIAWLVSNCHPSSTRKDYAAELARYVPVDVYGICGNYTCRKDNASCSKQISRQYLFMLSFENSYCTDYFTEKLVRALRMNIVPVTLGRARYSEFLPPKSYIDVRDFRSPQALAEYLVYLENNRTAYWEYFQWKVKYEAQSTKYTRPAAFCRLCEILHDAQYKYRTDLEPSQYWSRDRCLLGEAEKDQVHLQTSDRFRRKLISGGGQHNHDRGRDSSISG